MPNARRPGIGTWLPWGLLAMAVAIGLFLLDRGKARPEPPSISPVTATAVAVTGKPREAVNRQPRLQIDSRAGMVDVNGQLADADRARLSIALARTFKPVPVKGDIGIDASLPPAPWLDTVIALLPDFKARGIKFAIEDSRARVDMSHVPERERALLAGKIRGAFSGTEVVDLDD